MNTWKIEITLKVTDSWVADGFDASGEARLEQIAELFTELLPYAYSHECVAKAKIISAPTKEKIKGLQSGDLKIKD